MAIDRSFVVQGHGTVVTGSVTSGTVKVGDELEWLPRGELVRVRSAINPGIATRIALETTNGMAKMAPMTERHFREAAAAEA